MTIYNLDKGEGNDVNGQVLRDWINNNWMNINNLTIRDTGIATIENVKGVFNVCHLATNINISSFNTSNVTDMSGMFSRCSYLTTISNFNTSNVTNMSTMFVGCNNLTSIPNFNTSKVTDMYSMFSGCNNLIEISNFDTSNVTDMSKMYNACINLVDVPQFNTSNADEMRQTFTYCNNLSNNSIQNIINMCLNSNVTDSIFMNLNNANTSSPLYGTKFDNSYYQNRLTELDEVGWTY